MYQPIIDGAALVWSFFSEAFLVGGEDGCKPAEAAFSSYDELVPTVMDILALKWSLFEIFVVTIIIFFRSSKSVFLRVRACEDEAAIIVNFGDRPRNNGTIRFALKRRFQQWSHCILLKI